ncbi:MAG: hypothetical protein AAB804_02325 [Patescibacteria group bacterium]
MRAQFVREPSLANPLRSVRALELHRFLLRAALAGVNIFAWMFVFQYFYLVEADIAHALARTALLYALSQTITCLVTPYAARRLRAGARSALILGTLLAAVAFLTLRTMFDGFWLSAFATDAVLGFALAIGLYRALYWVPYSVEAAAHFQKKPLLIAEFLIACAPLVGGLFIAGIGMGFVWILYIGAAIIALSAIPAFFIRNVHEIFSWGYRETFLQLFEFENRRIVTGGFLEGISGAATLLFWPLAVFLIVDQSFGMLGIILTLTFWVAIWMRRFIRRMLRRLRLTGSSAANIVFAITPWLFRLAVATPLGIIFVDSFFYTTTPRRMGIDPLAFEQVADGGSYVDEFTALKEVAQALGRISLCILGATAVLLVSVPTALAMVFFITALSAAAGAYRSR